MGGACPSPSRHERKVTHSAREHKHTGQTSAAVSTTTTPRMLGCSRRHAGLSQDTEEWTVSGQTGTGSETQTLRTRVYQDRGTVKTRTLLLAYISDSISDLFSEKFHLSQE